MNKFFLSVFISFCTFQTNGFAQNQNTILLDVNELQKLVDLYAGSDSFPLSFWQEESVTIQGSLLKNQYGAECLSPIVRLPQKNIQEDQTPRIILHLFCKGRSTIEYGKLDIPCKYTKRSDIPTSMHAGEDPSECIQIKISMQPKIWQTSTGSEFGFEEIQVERLLLFPKSSGNSLHQAFLPVEKMFLEKMNESLKLVSSAWAKSSF